MFYLKVARATTNYSLFVFCFEVIDSLIFQVIAISLAILHASSQRFHRRQANFNRRHHYNPGPPNFNPRPPLFNPGFQPQFNPGFQQPFNQPSFNQPSFIPPQAPFTPTPPEIDESKCQSVEVFNRTADGWYGSLTLTTPSDTKGAQVEVKFDDFVPAFVVKTCSLNQLMSRSEFFRTISATLRPKTIMLLSLKTVRSTFSVGNSWESKYLWKHRVSSSFRQLPRWAWTAFKFVMTTKLRSEIPESQAVRKLKWSETALEGDGMEF